MKVIIFGLGNYYRIQKPKLESLSDLEIVAFADNNAALWGTCVDGRPVIPPAEIRSETFEQVIIVSLYVSEIYRQLLSLGLDSGKIVAWPHFWSERMQGRIEIGEPEEKRENSGKKILILSKDLGYDGATLAAIYAAKALNEQGNAVLAVPMGDEKLIRETRKEGIAVAVCPALPWLGPEEIDWVKQFDAVIVNTHPMLESAIGIRSIRPVLWWVHESSGNYSIVKMQYPEGIAGKEFHNVNICGVSRIAWRSFDQVHPGYPEKIMPPGIPDQQPAEKKKDGQKCIFAVIGVLYAQKGQDFFLDAAGKAGEDTEAEFWLIGRVDDNAYGREIRRRVEAIGSARLFGELTRTELDRIFPEIDVVVCASQEETLSLTVVEGMRSGKICIATKNTGVAEYLEDGKNGFLVPYGDTDALAAKMKQIIAGRESMNCVRQAARETYEKYFSMKAFGRRLEEMIKETEREWKEGQPFPPKVTVILPSLNVAAYIRECIESVINQTLSDIEILCIDAGSTDGTCEIIQEYANRDSRIRFIRAEKRSYGYQMNLGMKLAKGTYIGIVETDDSVEPDMYEVLWQKAREQDLDYVKAGFYTMVTPYEGERYLLEQGLGNTGQVFSSSYFVEQKLSPDVYIWNGIYKRSFLQAFDIRLNESPGAAFQDCGFRYLVDMHLRRGMFIDRLFYHYRRDNAAASTYNPHFVRFNLAECRYIRERMARGGIMDRGRRAFMARETVMMALSPYTTYREHSLPNEEILSDLDAFRKVILEDRERGLLRQEEMLPAHWIEMCLFTEEPEAYEAYIRIKARMDFDVYHNLVQEMAGKKQLVIFCTGKVAKFALCLFRMNRLENIVALCDNNPEKWGTSCYGHLVLSPEEAFRRYPQAYYLVAKLRDWEEILRQLLEGGIKEEQTAVYRLPLNAFGSTNLFMRTAKQE